MERGVIQAAARHTARRMRTAIQGDVIRALVELITNADDSYIRLSESGSSSAGRIEVTYQKQSYDGLFAVRDHAEGMSEDEVRRSFSKYGLATSGLKDGRRVRGYFGQGAKDALASMVDGEICTFKDQRVTRCRLFIEKGVAMYEMMDPVPATPCLRDQYGIPLEGTVASFRASPETTGRVPRFDTVHETLANNYLLRKVMINPDREVSLCNLDSGQTRRVRYKLPEGQEVLSEAFELSYEGYPTFQVQVSIWRADKGDLTQTGDDRLGGLLLMDGQESVLGISLFRYDNEPLAARLYGEVRIHGFRRLLENEEPVLREERDGLVPRHPFNKMLVTEIEARIESKVREERNRRQKERESKIGRREASRFRNAFSMLNQIAEVEAQEVTNLGDEPTDELEKPPNGFCVYPSSAEITVGKRYNFELRLNTQFVAPGAIIGVDCSNTAISLITHEVEVSPDEGTGIIRKYITVEGKEPNVEGILSVRATDRSSQATVYVLPEREFLFSEGMVFQPQSLTVRPNRSRKASLHVYVKMLPGGSRISVSSDNEAVRVVPDQVVVNEADAQKHVARYDLEIWGEGDGQDALVMADFETYMALMEVRVRSKEQQEPPSRKGMFREPEFSFDERPLQRTSYSQDTGKVIIYVNFPSVSHYLGADCSFRETLSSQVLIADLVAERCFYEIARRKVRSSAAVLRPEAIPDRVQRDAYELSRKYGKEVHQALVDQDLLAQAKTERLE